MKRASEIVVKAAFKRRVEEIEKDIESGKITFHNPPPVWTDKMIRVTAMNCALVVIAQEAKWN